MTSHTSDISSTPSSQVLPLDQFPQNVHCTIVQIEGEENQAMALRLGLCEGTAVKILSKVPGGPLVLCQGNLEVALGREICKSIQATQTVEPVV